MGYKQSKDSQSQTFSEPPSQIPKKVNKNWPVQTSDQSTKMEDKAYTCPGSCQGTVTGPRNCGDRRCNLVGKPLQQVRVSYRCKEAACPESMLPKICDREGCPQNGKLFEARAVTPFNMQYPILDPPEQNRSYSTIYGDNAIGEGHARSRIAGAQAWSAKQIDTNQWMIIDAGKVVDSIEGIVMTIRKDGHFQQVVTSVCVDYALEEGQWTEAYNTPTATLLTSNDSGMFVRLPFAQAVQAQYVRIRPVEWQSHISLRAAIIISGAALEEHFSAGGEDQLRTIVDVNQLPAQVPLHFIPGGNPPPVHQPRPLGILVLPKPDTEWAGRKFNWTINTFNGKATDKNVFAVGPGESCSIDLSFEARWRYNSKDYCPGCVVQLYYGMNGVFSTGVVEHGIHDHRGNSSTQFEAPSVPGLYYITSNISLMYNYVTVGHSNTPNNAFAAIRVLPSEFSLDMFSILPQFQQQQIIALMAFRNRKGDEATLFTRLPRQHLFAILAFFIGSVADFNQF